MTHIMRDKFQSIDRLRWFFTKFRDFPKTGMYYKDLQFKKNEMNKKKNKG